MLLYTTQWCSYTLHRGALIQYTLYTEVLLYTTQKCSYTLHRGALIHYTQRCSYTLHSGALIHNTQRCSYTLHRGALIHYTQRCSYTLHRGALIQYTLYTEVLLSLSLSLVPLERHYSFFVNRRKVYNVRHGSLSLKTHEIK